MKKRSNRSGEEIEQIFSGFSGSPLTMRGCVR